MINRVLYNLILYMALGWLLNIFDIRNPDMKFWFIAWVIAVFNIAISEKNKRKSVVLCVSMILAPFLIATGINNLLGDTTNIYNVSYEYTCGCSKSPKTFYIGYAYMIITTFFMIIRRIYRFNFGI